MAIENNTSVVKGRVLAKIQNIDDAQCSVLESLVDALGMPVQSHLAEDSDIVSVEFARHFQTRLQLHHATTREPFKKKSFEFAFQEASTAVGRKASMVSSGTNPGHDVTVDDVRFSLKTEAAKSIRIDTITISKLMEARWIRECRSGVDFCSGCRRITTHLEHYDRILTLRVFAVRTRDGKDAVRYELVEIPHAILAAVSSLLPGDFSPRTKNGGASAEVRYRGCVAFSLRLDGSVEKITISGLPLSLCRKHAIWTVPILVADSEDD